MPCVICLQERDNLKFRTGRLSICRYCVQSLNCTNLSAREAEEKWLRNFRESVISNNPEAITWSDEWFYSVLIQSLSDKDRVRRSHELKVVRAHRSGIICWNRKYLNYPHNWDFKRFKIKDKDKYACHICGAQEKDNVELHVHHIVFRSKSGTNSYRNLVTLCYPCHQAQHDHEISTRGGEPSGQDIDQSFEELDALWGEQGITILPVEFSEQAYLEVRPTLEVAKDAFLSNGKTAKDFFIFLIQTFGRNVGKYALLFAKEEKLINGWFRNKRGV